MSVRGLAVRLATSRWGVAVRRVPFGDSGRYWERRYSQGGTSGAGSYGQAASWKAACVNNWVAEHSVTSVIDWGCGDGHQLSLASYPKYLGVDRSPSVIRHCASMFAEDRTKSFVAYDPAALFDAAGWFRADLALSMEVIFHLVEDAIFDSYMNRLFDSAERFVVIVNSDVELPQRSPHERHRCFTKWVSDHRPEWKLVAVKDPSQDLNLLSSAHLYVRA